MDQRQDYLGLPGFTGAGTNIPEHLLMAWLKENITDPKVWTWYIGELRAESRGARKDEK